MQSFPIPTAAPIPGRAGAPGPVANRGAGFGPAMRAANDAADATAAQPAPSLAQPGEAAAGDTETKAVPAPRLGRGAGPVHAAPGAQEKRAPAEGVVPPPFATDGDGDGAAGQAMAADPQDGAAAADAAPALMATPGPALEAAPIADMPADALIPINSPPDAGGTAATPSLTAGLASAAMGWLATAPTPIAEPASPPGTPVMAGAAREKGAMAGASPIGHARAGMGIGEGMAPAPREALANPPPLTPTAAPGSPAMSDSTAGAPGAPVATALGGGPANAMPAEDALLQRAAANPSADAAAPQAEPAKTPAASSPAVATASLVAAAAAQAGAKPMAGPTPTATVPAPGQEGVAASEAAKPEWRGAAVRFDKSPTTPRGEAKATGAGAAAPVQAKEGAHTDKPGAALPNPTAAGGEHPTFHIEAATARGASHEDKPAAPHAEAAAAPGASPSAPPALAAPAMLEPPRAPPAASPVRQLTPTAVALASGTREGETSTLSVSLDPAALGRVEITVEKQAGQTVIRVTAERGETLALLQRDQRDLARSLDQAGLSADGGFSMSFSLSGQGAGQGEGHRQDPRHATPQGGPGGWGGPGTTSALRSDAAPERTPARRALSLLDLDL